MDCNTPGFPIFHYLLQFVQTLVHCINDATQLSHPLLPPSPHVFCPFLKQGLFQRVGSSYCVAKVLELQLQHQSFQGILRVDFL